MATVVDQDNLLDFDLDELEALPGIVVPPAGSYLVEGVALEQLVDEEKGRKMRIRMVILATSELAKDDAVPVPDGTEISWEAPMANPEDLFWIKAAVDNIRKVTHALKEVYSVTGFVGLAEKFPGTQFGLVITNRKFKTKEGEDGVSANIKTVITA